MARVSLITAMTPGRVIGRDNTMPWHLPADLRRFKRLTIGKPIVMGRKTFESLGRILPERHHIVVSRGPAYRAPGAQVVASIDAALQAAGKLAEEIFIIGGAEIYRQALPHADRIYITLIEAHIEGDIYFPAFDPARWREVERTPRAADDKNPYPLTFLVMDRHTGQ